MVLGWINPIPSWFFGRNSVFLAIGSVLWNCQICLKIMFSTPGCKVIVIGKTLLKKVSLDKIRELRSMAFPLKERYRLESCCVFFFFSFSSESIAVVNTGYLKVFCEVNS